jgi:hypothetical protein
MWSRALELDSVLSSLCRSHTSAPARRTFGASLSPMYRLPRKRAALAACCWICRRRSSMLSPSAARVRRLHGLPTGRATRVIGM